MTQDEAPRSRSHRTSLSPQGPCIRKDKATWQVNIDGFYSTYQAAWNQACLRKLHVTLIASCFFDKGNAISNIQPVAAFFPQDPVFKKMIEIFEGNVQQQAIRPLYSDWLSKTGCDLASFRRQSRAFPVRVQRNGILTFV